MDVLTYEPNQLQLTPIEKLSKGTVDQMYFGLRLSIIDIMSEGASLPLILDDCFTQYDDERLEKSPSATYTVRSTDYCINLS